MSSAWPEPEAAGFRRNPATGLILPTELSRQREVWTKTEHTLLARATKLLKARGLQILLRCEETSCQSAPIMRRRDPQSGDIHLECAHKTRVFQRQF
jgi:hypothetical protein